MDPFTTPDHGQATTADVARRPYPCCLWCGADVPAGEEFCGGAGSECWHHFTSSVEQDYRDMDEASAE